MVMPLSHLPVHTVKFFFFFTCFLYCGCRKDSTEIVCLKVASGTNDDLTSIHAFNDTLYITGNSGFSGALITSVDKGSSWHLVKNDFNCGLNDLCLYHNSFFAAADSFRVYRSDDSGKTWFPLWIQGAISIEYTTDIKSIGSSGNRLYMCGGSELGHGFAAVSNDEGFHWKFLQSDHELRAITFADELHGVCAGYGALYYTGNGGETWIMQDALSQFWTSISYSDGKYIACSFSGDVVQSEDGISWSFLRRSSGMFKNNIYLNGICRNGSALIGAGLNGKGILSNNSGMDWKNIIFADHSHIYTMLINEERNGIAAGEQGLIYKFSY
jgi:hypothetical protein